MNAKIKISRFRTYEVINEQRRYDIFMYLPNNLFINVDGNKISEIIQLHLIRC